jgi:hypothetical protein
MGGSFVLGPPISNEGGMGVSFVLGPPISKGEHS